MKKLFADPIKAAFDEGMATALPDFVRLGSLPEFRWYARAYRLVAASDLTFYVFMIFGSYDKYAFEIAWSRDNSIPSTVNGRAIFDRVPLKGGFLERLSYINSSKDIWYEADPLEHRSGQQQYFNSEDIRRMTAEGPTADDIGRLVTPAMDATFTRLTYYTLPYFEKVAMHFGHKFQSQIVLIQPLSENGERFFDDIE